MSTDTRIRVMIADDHQIVREGLAAIIEHQEDMIVVAEAATGLEALERFRQLTPDVVLMDLQMPGGGGIETIQAIREAAPQARIIILTTYQGEEDIYQGIKAGARAYLLKTSGREELLETIRMVHEGQTRIPPNVATRLAERMSIPELTPREMEVLRLVTEGKSNQEIGLTLYITEGTVKSHVNSILSKLKVSDRTQAALAALKRGLVHMPYEVA